MATAPLMAAPEISMVPAAVLSLSHNWSLKPNIALLDSRLAADTTFAEMPVAPLTNSLSKPVPAAVPSLLNNSRPVAGVEAINSKRLPAVTTFVGFTMLVLSIVVPAKLPSVTAMFFIDPLPLTKNIRNNEALNVRFSIMPAVRSFSVVAGVPCVTQSSS